MSGATLTEPCRLWHGARSGAGYGERTVGSLRDGTRRVRAVHRLAWEEAHGPVPAGMFVCHHCDVRHCYEITHLFIGTARDNVHDAMAKGRLVAPPHNAGLTDEQVIEIRATVKLNPTGIHGGQIGHAAQHYGVHPKTIRDVVKGRRYCRPDGQPRKAR